MKHDSDRESESAASPHTIRLRGPSDLLWLRNGTQQARVRVHIPCEISPDLFELSEVSADDTFVLQRNFRQPTGLDQSQSVTLMLSEFEGARQVTINSNSDEEVACVFDGEEVSIDVTQSLKMQNRFEVEFHFLPAHAGEALLKIQ